MEGYKFAAKERVRYQHIDVQGIVFHPRYVEFLAQARVEYLRNLDITIRSLTDKGYDLVTREVNCYFKKPAHLDEMILINTRVAWIRNTSFGFEYVLQEEKTGDILVTASSGHNMVCLGALKPVRIPDEYREIILELEGPQLQIINSSER